LQILNQFIMISDEIAKIKSEIPHYVKLIAVSKTKPNEMIQQAYNGGHLIFGENRPLELKQKHEELPRDIEWHFIGHPQSKQVKYFSEFVSLIHGVDSIKLMQVINKEGIKHNRKIPCLLQFHIAQETTKFGLVYSEAQQILESKEFSELKNIEIAGVMGMATYTDNNNQIASEFRLLRSIYEQLKQTYFTNNEYFKELSMGMSDDYNIAIDEGSTMIRVGSKIFGYRNYNQ